MDRVRVRMLESFHSLAKGEEVNLPLDVAEDLVAAKKAEYVAAPGPKENKVVGPTETKIVAPAEVKEAKTVTAADIVNNKKKSRK